MGVSFFQTSPRDQYSRYAILLNSIALIILLVAFGYSYNAESEVSSIRLSTDYFKTDNIYARVSATRIFAKQTSTNSEVVVCPQADFTATNISVSSWYDCEEFSKVAKLTLGFDGITIVALVFLYCAQRYATVTVSDERRLLGIYFGLQLIPLGFHVLARVIFDGGAVRRAISFLKASGVTGGQVNFSDEDVGLHYGPVQALHATVAALLTASLALFSLKFFQITLQRRIDSVELVRECAARIRGDNPDKNYPPLRWMLDPRYHPLFDADQLETIRQKLIESKGGDAEDAETKLLRAKLEEADKEWEEQQKELEFEEEAYKEYSHRIRREERVETRVVVDDWERQQIVWQQRKEASLKHFSELGFSLDGKNVQQQKNNSSSAPVTPAAPQAQPTTAIVEEAKQTSENPPPSAEETEAKQDEQE